MNIIKAAQLLKEGTKVRLPHWEKHDYICNVNGVIIDNKNYDVILSTDRLLNDDWEEYIEGKQVIELDKFEDLKQDYKITTWEEYIEGKQIKLHSFSDGLKALKQGYRITINNSNVIYQLLKSGYIVHFKDGRSIGKDLFSIGEILSNDWVILNKVLSDDWKKYASKY